MGQKCTALKWEQKPGDPKKLFAKWQVPHMNTFKIDHFELVTSYKRTEQAAWINEPVKNVAPVIMGNYYYYEYTPPSAAVARYVCFNVMPVSAQYDEWYWDGDKAKSRKATYFQGEYVNGGGPWADVPEWKTQNATLTNETKNGGSFDSKAQEYRTNALNNESKASSAPTGTAAQKRAAARIWDAAAGNWAACAKSAESASKAYASAITAATALGEPTATLQSKKDAADSLKSTASTRQRAAESQRDSLNTEADSQDAGDSAAAAKKQQRDRMVGAAISAWRTGEATAKNANAYFKSKDFSAAAGLYQAAAKMYDDAAYWYGEAVAYATNDDDKRYLNQEKAKASAANDDLEYSKDLCDGYVDAAEELYKEQASTPDAPSVSYEQRSNHIHLEVECSAEWSTRITVYRSTDYQPWTIVKTFNRVLPPEDEDSEETGKREVIPSPWMRQRWDDGNIADGHSYRYFAKCYSMHGAESDDSGISETFKTKPTRPEDLALSLAGYDDEGKANIRVDWKNTSNVADEIEVQYSTWVGNDNAWNENALDKITTVKANSGQSVFHTLTGMERGKRLLVRVRAVNSTGAAWAYTKGGKEKNYATAAIWVPAEVVPGPTQPTALKAVLAASPTAADPSGGKVTLSWADKLEAGATFRIEHSANPKAWAQNAAGDITSVDYSDPGGGEAGSSTKTFTVTGLGAGTRYFEVAKILNGKEVRAKTATGASYYLDWIAQCEVPAPVAASVRTPTALALAKSTDTSILVTWNDPTQAAGEGYEIQAADYSAAFTDNAVGDITSNSLDEVTTATQKRFTLTSMERGRTWYVRVRKKAEAGVSNWSTVKSIKLAGETIRQPTGLRLEKVSGDSTRIKATWTDAPESGTEYTLRIAPSLAAFQNNALAEIEEHNYTPETSTADNPDQYTFIDLVPGTTYYVQLVKTKDAMRQQGKAASGSTKADTYTAYLKLDAAPVQTITVPTGVTAIPRTSGGELVTEGDGSKAAAQVAWVDTKADGESYEVQYTDDSAAFADNALGYIQSADFEGESGSTHSMAVTGLDRGRTWYFRVRKKAEAGQGGWSATASCFLEAEPEPAEELAAPTTVDTLGGYAAGDAISLAWTHNSAQETTQTGYQLEITVTKPGGRPTRRIVETAEQTANNVYSLSTVDWGLSADGTKVEWRVRTSGAVFKAWGPWSRVQSFKVFARPAAYVTVPAEVSVMPLGITLSAASSGGGSLTDENAPIEYQVEIRAKSGYEQQSSDGSTRYVAAGEAVYSKTIDQRDAAFSAQGWELAIQAQEIRLAGGQSYTVTGTVLTAQGMRGSAESEFSVLWSSEMPQPSCVCVPNVEQYTMLIKPWCGVVADYDEEEPVTPVVPEAAEMTEDERKALEAWGYVATEGDYSTGYVDPGLVQVVQTRIMDELRENTVLYVYRVGSDGEAVEIAADLPNDGQICCVDPHPDFGESTYRIVALDTATGMQSVYECTAEMPVEHIVVQWDEQWMEGEGLTIMPTYYGKRMELERNLETSESYAMESSLRSYAGRSHPVSYYGTQKGQTASLKGVALRGYENETVAAARELAAWPGDCYVREPMGTGYWANVKPSIGVPRNSAAISVTLEAVRVDGGK
ncbi:MAG: hypothetical protein IJ586_00225 [Alloprevotella sp.]|nr:hypothetical protein [Alloprevotella sp.]